MLYMSRHSHSEVDQHNQLPTTTTSDEEQSEEITNSTYKLADLANCWCKETPTTTITHCKLGALRFIQQLLLCYSQF